MNHAAARPRRGAGIPHVLGAAGCFVTMDAAVRESAAARDAGFRQVTRRLAAVQEPMTTLSSAGMGGAGGAWPNLRSRRAPTSALAADANVE